MGSVLIPSNSGGGSGTPEGTAVLSTGEVGATKFLREDGDGTCSWQTPAGGGSGGTVQGTDATYDIEPTNQGATVGNARGENSVDLCTVRSDASYVCTGVKSGALAGEDIGGTGTHTAYLAGKNNHSNSGDYCSISGANNSGNFGDFSNISGKLASTTVKIATTGTSAAAATNLITKTSHGVVAGSALKFTTLTGGTGLNTTNFYYARDISANTFAVSQTVGGAAESITVDYTVANYIANGVNYGFISSISGYGNYGNTGSYATITGYNNHTNSGDYSSISGSNNYNNRGVYSSIGGESNNTNSGHSCLISGSGNYSNTGSSCNISGNGNHTNSGPYCSITGYNNNSNSGNYCSISGYYNYNNSGNYCTISGGGYYGNHTNSGHNCTISGYNNKTNSGNYCVISGKSSHTNTGAYCTISGESHSSNSGTHCSISGQSNGSGSGDWCIIGGKGNSSNTGNHTIISGTNNSSNSGNYCSISGYYANSNNLDYAKVHGGGANARIIDLVAMQQTVGAVTNSITLGGQVEGAVGSIIIPVDTAWAFVVHVVAIDTTNGYANSKKFSFDGLCLNDGGTVTVTSATLGTDATQGTFTGSVALSADTTYDALKIEATGIAATTINWTARVELTQVN